ncbi:hypothetical protein Cni_G08805 [Canna indica]|uniref:Uncharacterized protein n=1 Tax=Canna indica TaxID=4628 RepID=A0AAQ3K4P5_9LILI|nr:hypothetical protein Cni_G08805 [Canna indica]
MNDLSAAVVADRRRLCSPVPAAVPRVLVPLFLVGLAVAVFILVVVHNAALLVAVLLVSALIIGLFIWNAVAYRRSLALNLFLDRFPDTDLLTAKDGQLVKVSGLASCGDLSLESSYEKAGRCVYTSTLLYEYCGCKSKRGGISHRSFQWKLAYAERLTTDFYITDVKTGIRAFVKAGYGSKVIPLIEEKTIVNITSLKRELSSTLKRWLQARRLSCEARPLCLEEGYVKEETLLTVMGMLSIKNGVPVIVPLPETISTDCLLQKFLLPVDIDGSGASWIPKLAKLTRLLGKHGSSLRGNPSPCTIHADLLGHVIFIDNDERHFQHKMAGLALGSVWFGPTPRASRPIDEINCCVASPVLHRHRRRRRWRWTSRTCFNDFAFETICRISFGLNYGYLELSMPMAEFAAAFDIASLLSAWQGTMPTPMIWRLNSFSTSDRRGS